MPLRVALAAFAMSECHDAPASPPLSAVHAEATMEVGEDQEREEAIVGDVPAG
jgi:hypothetical protein